MLVRELKNAHLIEASSMLELRLTPERLTNEIVRFVDRCFSPPPAERSRTRTRSAARRSDTTHH
jgi:hypothetical protein